MQTRLRPWTPSLALLALLISSVVSSTEALAQKVEVGVYGGGSFFSRPSFTSTYNSTLNSPQFPTERVEYDVVDGGVFGIRVRENLWEKFGLEQSWTITGTNNAVFPGVVVGNRMHQLYFNANINAFTSEQRFRPYFSAGLGWSSFSPTDEGKVAWAINQSQFSDVPQPIDKDTEFGANFGVGFKTRLVRALSLDFSVRDFVFRSPTFNLPNPSGRDVDNNLQLQAGLSFNIGGNRPLIVHTFSVAPTITATNTSLCPGESSTLQISASDSIPNNRVTYQWTVGGQEVASGPEYTFVAPRQGGPYNVGVKVFYDDSQLDKNERKAVEKNPGAPAERRITMDVQNYQPPTAIASMDRNTVQRGERVRFTSNATGSACSGNLTHRWTANDGRIAAGADGISADFDSSTLAFNDAVQGQQCKPVRVSLAVTDQKGGTASDAKDIQVCYTAVARAPAPPPKPNAIQLSDINFGTNSARVNNCAKRVLANDLYPQLTDARYRNYDVLLVGHRDSSEVEKVGKAANSSALDRQRVLNAAAYLSAGGASCKDIELSRVKVAWAATDQTNDFRSNFCDASTQVRGREKVNQADEKAKNRRVEVWLVPKDASLPSGIGTTPITPDAIGCPR